MQQKSCIQKYGYPCRAIARRFFQCSLVAASLVVAGCAGTYDTLSPPFGANPNPEDRSLDGQYARSELDDAARMIRGGHYAQAILRLERIVDKYGTTEAGIEARYLLATAYEQIGGLEKARDHYARYVTMAPHGPRAEASAERLALLSGEGTPTAQEKDPTVLALRDRIQAAPGDMAPSLELADHLWRGERYSEAGELYVWMVERWPNLLSDGTVRRRIVRERDGSFTLLTPEEVVRRARAEQPLQIVNVQSFRSGMGRSGSFAYADLRNRYFHVSGEVVNQGEQPLRSVQVRVTLFGVGRRIYDTRTVSVGTVGPGNSLPFSVRFENFDNIENVQDFECVGTYVQ